MIRTAYLRVYQPLDSFDDRDRAALTGESSGSELEERAARRWLVAGTLPGGFPDGAFVREVDGVTLVCPWRTRLRMLAGLLAFRNSLPDEVADAFVPEQEATRAAHELATLGDERPAVRSHILHANWHVPLRWFAAFADDERILTEDKDGLHVRYETPLAQAKQRLHRCAAVLEARWIDESVTAAVRELVDWLEDFPTDGLIELDYGTVAGMFDPDDLVEDRSALEVQSCLEALNAGDVLSAGRLFSALTDRWTELRAHEVVN